MSYNNQSNDAASEKGCIAIIGLVAIAFVTPMLIQLLQMLIVVAAIGGVGFLGYQMYLYNERTGKITLMFERIFKINNDTPFEQNTNSLNEPTGNYLLPSATEQTILESLNDIKNQVEGIKIENEKVKIERNQDLQNALTEIEKKNKQTILNDIFGNSSNNNYVRSDEFEKQSFQEALKKKEEQIEIRELKHYTAEQVFEQDKKLYEFKNEVRTEQFRMREEYSLGMMQLKEGLMLLQQNMVTLKVYVDDKFSKLELVFFKEIMGIKEEITKLRADVSTQFSDVKLQFGKEILRLDQQQVRIVDKLQSFHHQIQLFGVEMKQIRNDAERYSIRAEDILNKANLAHERHQVAIQGISKDLNLNLQQMALHKQDFANQVGSAKLELDKISQDQYLALKDVAYERMGINMLRNEYQQRATLEQTKMQNLVAEQRRIEERIQEKISRREEASQLQHQLFMTREDLKYTSNKANLLQQEASIVRRYSK